MLFMLASCHSYARPRLLRRVEPRRWVSNVAWQSALHVVKRTPLSLDDVEVRHAEGKGLGVFTTRFLAQGLMVGRYEGIMRSNRTFEWALEQRLTTGLYAFQLSSGSYVDGEDASRSSWTRYINHAPTGSASANVAPYGRGRPFIYFETVRDVEAGEELCFDCEFALEHEPLLPRPSL